MKSYTAKTVEEAVALASEELGIPADNVIFRVIDEKKGLRKKAEIEVYELTDAIEYSQEYIKSVLESLGVGDIKTKASLEDDIIRIEIDTDHNPILIGNGGKTLQALNELVKVAVSNHFRRRFRILLDINGYKDKKYDKLTKMARRIAHEVQKSKTTYTFDPMPSDERRVIHNACSGMKNIKTESTGEGSHRQLQIIYVE